MHFTIYYNYQYIALYKNRRLLIKINIWPFLISLASLLLLHCRDIKQQFKIFERHQMNVMEKNIDFIEGSNYSLLELLENSTRVCVQHFPYGLTPEEFRVIFEVYGPFSEIQWIEKSCSKFFDKKQCLLFITCESIQKARNLQQLIFTDEKFKDFLFRWKGVIIERVLPKNIFELVDSHFCFKAHYELWQIKFINATKLPTSKNEAQFLLLQNMWKLIALGMTKAKFQRINKNWELSNKYNRYHYKDICIPYEHLNAINSRSSKRFEIRFIFEGNLW